jgi:hypothetical protein
MLDPWWSLVPALVMALVHTEIWRLRRLNAIPRSRWLSFAGGTAVAYVFLHLLPEWNAAQRQVSDHLSATAMWDFLSHHVYLLALAGLVTFYGCEHLARRHGAGGEEHSPADQSPDSQSRGMLVLHLTAFILYNLIIGTVLVEQAAESWHELTLYTLAIGLHMIVIDASLRHHHGRDYLRFARWLLAAAILIGTLAALWWQIPPLLIHLLSAFLGGGILLNIIKEELPDERQSRFPSFLCGAIAYGALMVIL